MTAAIDIPVPGLAVLIGAAGSGKSTLAARLFAADEILSSDAVRAALSGDPADQRVTGRAFRILHAEAARRLAAGRLVVIDATNVQPSARMALLRLAAGAGAPATAIVLALPAPLVHARNAARPERTVPAPAVDRQLAALARMGDAPTAIASRLRGEGFAAVHIILSASAIDTVTIVRRPGRARAPAVDPAG